MSAGVAKFALDNLAIFERHGAKASRTRGKRAGCHVKFRNGWTLSVQRVQHVADLIARGVLVKGGVAGDERES